MAKGLVNIELDNMTTYELIDALDEFYPRMLPQPDVHSQDYIMHEAGKRELIETLMKKKERELHERRNSQIKV